MLTRHCYGDYKQIIDAIKDIFSEVSIINLEDAIQTLYSRGDYRAFPPEPLENTIQLGHHCDYPREIFIAFSSHYDITAEDTQSVICYL